LAALVCAVSAGLAPGQVPKMSPSLDGQMRLFEPRVIAGRIVAISSHAGQNTSSSRNGSDRRERLSIKLTQSGPSVSYELTTPSEQIGFEIVAGDRVTLRRQYRTEQGTASTEFYQIPDRPIIVLSGPADASVRFEAPTLWHLFLAEPELCRQQIVPLLELMRPDWPVRHLADEIEERLCRASETPVLPDQGAWEQWVAELGGNRYSQRQTADRRLRESGPRVLPFLQRIDRARLDMEQSRRIRDIIRSIAGEEDEDTADRATLWLVDDPRAWYALTAREEVAKRRLAAEQLARLLKGPIEFDPIAPAAIRQVQRAALAKRIEPAGQPPADEPSRERPSATTADDVKK
jgi:hypothetical protein